MKSSGFVAGAASSLLLTVWCVNVPNSVSAAVTVRIGQNFTGSTYGIDSPYAPADSNGSAGPSHFVEFINGRFSVYEKTTGTRVKTMTDVQFWNQAGLNFASNVGTTDPRLLYDTYSKRWVASMVDLIVNRPRQRSNHFLLAISQTDDPTGQWNAFSFASDTNSVNFADFPTLGADEAAVYLSGDMFDRLGNPFGTTLVAIAKTNLLADPPSVAGRRYFAGLTYSSRGDILQPAITSGNATTPESIIAVSDLGLDSLLNPNGPHTTVILSSIRDGGTASPSLSAPPVVLDVPSYSVPIDPTQPDGSNNLGRDDARISASARRVGDVLYAVHAVQESGKSAARWYKINAVNNTLIQAGTLTDPEMDLAFPSIAANEAGIVVIGCNGSSSSTFVSSYVAVGETAGGTLTFGSLTLLKAGKATYSNPDQSGDNRWGDYSATSVDPIDPNRFWTIQMIPVSAGAWATQITEIITSSPNSNGPQLAVTRSGGDLVLSWPATSGNFQLQSASALFPSPIWTPVTTAPAVSNGVATAILPAANGVAFFRLVSAGST